MPNRLFHRAAAAAKLLFPDATAPTVLPGRYDRLIDGLNRLPRPVLVSGTVALLFLTLLQPEAFDRGMASLDRMPEELWWLIGAILAGHFGAREAHHLRHRGDLAPPDTTPALPEKQGSDRPS